MLGADPYDSDYPRDLIITPEFDSEMNPRRLHFALWGENGSYTAELRISSYLTFRRRMHSGKFSGTLHVERWWQSRIQITSPPLIAAFVDLATDHLAKAEKVLEEARTKSGSLPENERGVK